MGFNPANFPPIANAEQLRSDAKKFKDNADKVDDLAADSHSAWSAMTGVYEAPEAPIVYGAFGPVKTSGQDLADDAGTLKTAVDTYADEADSIKSRYEALMVRYRAVESQKASDDEWQEDEDLVKEDNDILSDANALMADYMAAQRACANKISGIYGGPKYVATTQEGSGAGEVQYGFTGEQLDAAAAEGKLPWGEPSEYDAPWYEDGWNIVASFGKGVWSGVTGTVTGLWNMVNFTDWDTFSTTWKGIGTLAVDVAVLTSPVGLALSGTERKKEAAQRLLAVGKSAIHWDKWQEDPAYAAGATTFDLATILATAGAGAVTKTGSVASKISKVSGAGTKAGTAVKVTGMGSVANVTVKVADLATDLKIKSLDLSTSVGREALGKLGPVASRIDDGINAMPGPAPAYAGVGSPGPRPFSDAVDAGISRMDSQANGGGNGTPAGGSAGAAGSSLHGGGDIGAPAPAHGRGDTGAPAPAPGGADAPDAGGPGSNPLEADRTGTDSPEAPADKGSGEGAPASTPDGSDMDAPKGGDVDADTLEGDREGSGPAGATEGDGSDTGVPEGEGTGTDAPGRGDPDGTDSTQATVATWNPDGTPKEVLLPNGHTHTVSMSSDQLADSTTARQEAVLASARDHGLSQQKFEELIHMRGDELTPEQAAKLVDIRHSIELSNGQDTIFQKVLNPAFVEGTLDNTSDPRFTRRMGGFISDGADTAQLRTSQDIINGLRLDYTGSPFDPDESVHAVRFQTSQVENIGIPDELSRQALPDGHPAADLPDVQAEIQKAPHTGTGWTGSTVDGQEIVPEYSVIGREGIPMDSGAEMWRVTPAGDELLVGIFDGTNWVRVG